jgi:hypothetical protein
VSDRFGLRAIIGGLLTIARRRPTICGGERNVS